jgi:hypothetical protein
MRPGFGPALKRLARPSRVGDMAVADRSCQRQLLVAATAMPLDSGGWTLAAQLNA